MYVVSDESYESGPVKLPMNIADSLSNPGVTGKVMIMVGSENVKLDICMIRDVEGPLE